MEELLYNYQKAGFETHEAWCEHLKEERLQAFIKKQEEEQEEEYFTRVKYFYTEFKNGRAIIPTSANFHPTCFKGTQAEYDLILEKYFHDDSNGKVIGIHSFDTYEELNERFNWARARWK